MLLFWITAVCVSYRLDGGTAQLNVGHEVGSRAWLHLGYSHRIRR